MVRTNLRKYSYKKVFPRFCFGILDFIGFLFFSRKREIPKNISNILVFRPDHLGDVVFSIPSLEILKEKFPDAQIDILIGPWSSSLIKNTTQFDSNNFHILEYACPWLNRPKIVKFGFLSIFQIAKLLKDRMLEIGRTYDIAIDLRGDFQLIMAARIARIPFLAGRGSTGLGFLLDTDVRIFEDRHLVESNLFLLEKSGLGEFPFKEPEIKISSENKDRGSSILRENGANFLKPLIGIHPGAGLGDKRWPSEKMAALVERFLFKKRYQVVLLGGPDDKQLIQKLLEFLPPLLKEEVIDLSGKVNSLRTFMGVIKNINLYIGNDSGPTHIASAINVPVVCIFQGTNDPSICRPLGNSAFTVSAEPKNRKRIQKEYPPPSFEEVCKVVDRCV